MRSQTSGALLSLAIIAVAIGEQSGNATPFLANQMFNEFILKGITKNTRRNGQGISTLLGKRQNKSVGIRIRYLQIEFT